MIFNLKKEMFSDREFIIAQHKEIRATAFKYSSGVEAIKVENKKGYFIILPFQGQQIWRANFCGKELVMETGFDEPMPTKSYLETYGGFLLHCGINAFGSPSSEDDHPQHGETPNADYDNAYIECGEDENGAYMTIGGKLTFKKSFVKWYEFSPSCKLYEDGTFLNIGVELENKRNYPMEYMYLCHINFRPIDGAELVYSAPYDKEHIKVYKTTKVNIEEPRRTQLFEYMDEVEENPEIMNVVGAEGQAYDPEICFRVKYSGDENNRAYTMQYTDDGACYASHPVDVLPDAIRWISRTLNENSMGMVLPCTAEHMGYTHAKNNGQIKILPPNEKLTFKIQAGYLEKADADIMKDKINKMMNR